MKFLVVLISVTVNYFWKHDLDRFDDSWFFRLRGWIESRTAALAVRYEYGWLAPVLLVFFVPLGILGGIILLIDGQVFGLLTLGVHVIVLLFAMDRTHPGMLAQNYLERWRRGDMEACYLYLTEELARPGIHLSSDMQQLHADFGRLYTYRCFERMFVMIFWYVIAGPLAVLFLYICYQYRDSSRNGMEENTANIIALVLALLEWLPLRLLGLTFCLVGDFESCFSKLKSMILHTDRATDEAVYALAISALRIDRDAAMPDAEWQLKQDAQGSFNEQAAQEIDSLQALLERSQIIWLCFLALAAVFGF